MLQTSFHLDITVSGTAKIAHQHIADVPRWWARDFQGSAQALGDIFTVRFGTTWVTFRVSALTDHAVTWTVQDCFLPWLKNRQEWTGTTVEWVIVPIDDGCEIQFTHVGLTPEVECYGGCAEGWTRYVTTSLPNLFKGLPGVPK
jgi:hypothetical protein